MKYVCKGLLLTFILFYISCSVKKEFKDPIPKHNTFTLQSKHLGEFRIINVWVPDSFNSVSDSLPVMYMADGGIQEDFPHVANTLSELIQLKKIKPTILVGIENTQRRRDLSGPTEVEEDRKIAPVVGGADKFRAFIQDELIPEINRKYATTKERGIIGESLSGLFVFETFLLTPDMFDYYIAFDPSLWWNNHYLVRNAKDYISKFPTSEKRLWFASSSAKDISVYAKDMVKILQIERRPNIEWKFSNEPNEKHNTIFRAAKEKAIIWTLSIKPELH